MNRLFWLGIALGCFLSWVLGYAFAIIAHFLVPALAIIIFVCVGWNYLWDAIRRHFTRGIGA